MNYMSNLKVGDLVYTACGFLPGIIVEKKKPLSIHASQHTSRLSENYFDVYYVLFPENPRKEGPYYESELKKVHETT